MRYMVGMGFFGATYLLCATELNFSVALHSCFLACAWELLESLKSESKFSIKIQTKSSTGKCAKCQREDKAIWREADGFCCSPYGISILFLMTAHLFSSLSSL